MGIAQEIEELDIPCHVEGPIEPEEGWACIHIDALGGWSYTIAVHKATVCLSIHTYSLGHRQMRTDDPHKGRCRQFEFELGHPKSVDHILRLLLSEIKTGPIIASHMSMEEKLARLRRGDHYVRRPVFLKKPYYLIG